MSEEAKAVQETAKAISKGLETSEKLGGFIARIIDGPLEQAMGIWEDKLRFRRWSNQLRLRDQVEEEMERRGMKSPTRPVPLQFAIPILEAAALEEDDYIRQFWATMLVNAADETVDVQMRRAYVSILEDLTSLDVKILETIYSFDGGSPVEDLLNRGFYVGYLPGEACPPLDYTELPSVSLDIEVAIGNLIRLGLLKETESIDGGSDAYSVSKTQLGAAFFKSCS